MNEHRHIIVEGEELYHYGIKGMKWKDHVYAATNKAGSIAKASAKKAASAASKFAKKAGKKASKLAKKAATSIMSTKAGKKASKLAKKAAAAAKNPKKAIQDAKFESMKKRTEAARKPGKEPGMAQKRKIADARRNADLQVTRENMVDMRSRGKIKDPRNAAETINTLKAATGTANLKKIKTIDEKYDKYYSDAKKQKKAAFTTRARSQKVGKKKTNSR